MPRSPVPEWRRRKEPIVDDWVLASVQQAGGPGKHHPETGHYATLLITGLADRAEAEEYVRALNRCALYLHRAKIADVGMSAKVEQGPAGYVVRFKAIDKTLARQHVLQRYGPDRSKWPYDPRRRTAP